MRTAASVAALIAALSACANAPVGGVGTANADRSALDADINVAALDPLNAPPPSVEPLTAPVAAAADPLLLVPSSGDGSQRVPLGTLNASSDPKPAVKAPTPLARRETAITPPAPVVQEFVPASVPAAPAPQTTVAAATPAPPPMAGPPAPAREETRSPAVPPPPPPPTPRGVTAAAPDPRPPAPTTGAPANPSVATEEETTVISSATAAPAVQNREFVPASVVPVAAPPAPPPLGEMPFTQAERNIARRFETLARLRDEGLITQDEFARRRAANLGALLPYSQDPPGVGLDRSVPGSDAIVARLGALRRSFEMRAITAQQHALERTMILNALLPENPEQRTARKPPPEDVIQGAAMVGRLESLREAGVVTQPELDAERRMIDAVLRTGLIPPKGADPAKAPPAKAAAKPAAEATASSPPPTDNPMTREITGPVLHLASFRSEASARQGWQQVLENNKAALGTMKPIIRRVDLGEGRGIFYRLMMGSFASMAEAEATCVKLKQNNQFCRTSADGS